MDIMNCLDKWLLRLESISFIMVVHKETNEYRNIYLKDLKNQEELFYIIRSLDKHKNK